LQHGVANHNPSVPSPAALKPIQDEWGLFDPKQAGVEALVRKILTAAHDRELTTHEPPAREKK
jgi:hypothetical protein